MLRVHGGIGAQCVQLSATAHPATPPDTGRPAAGCCRPGAALIGRVMLLPVALTAASLASIRGWFHFSHRSYSMLGLWGLVVASISVGET